MRGEALSELSDSACRLLRDKLFMVEVRESVGMAMALLSTLSSSAFASSSKFRLKSKCETSILLRLKNMFSLKLFDMRLEELRSNEALSKALNFDADAF